MTVTAAAGVWGFGIQAAKGTLATVWYRHRAADINFGPIQDLRSFPLEVGGIVTPTGGYKAGAFVGGGATIQPRLAGDLGWLFKALMGAATTTPGTASSTAVHAAILFSATSPVTTGWVATPTSRRLLFTAIGITGGNIVITSISGTNDAGDAITDTTAITITGTGVGLSVKEFKTVTSVSFTATGVTAGSWSVGFYQSNSHVFKFATDPTSIPWVSMRKKVPGTTSYGEIGLDCKMAGARINFPQNGLVQARMDGVGREPSFEEGGTVDAWVWWDAFEDYQSVPVTCKVGGFMKLPSFSGTALPITNVVASFGNNLTTPQQEMIIGSPYPDDFAILSRALTLQATLKWQDQSLYKKIFYGALTAWDPQPFTSDFQTKTVSPGFIPGSTTVDYSIQIDAPLVQWNVNGPIMLEGGNMLSLQLVGQVMQPTTGEYCTYTVVNEQAGY